jgi:hypothetical protein
MTPIVLNAGYRATVFNIFPDEFWSCLALILSCNSIPSIWNGTVYSQFLYVWNTLFLQGLIAKNLPWRDFELGIWTMQEQLRL